MKKKMMFAAAVTALLAINLTGCGVKITNISIPETAIVEKGDSINLPINFGTDSEPAGTPETAEVDFSTTETAADDKIAKAAEKLTVEWASSDESVATVDVNGNVTAVGAGSAEITALVADSDLIDVCEITVKVTATDLAVPDGMNIVLNDTTSGSVAASYLPEDATDVELTYSSSDESVATVDENGDVNVVTPGECDVITVLFQDGQKVLEKTTHITALYNVDGVVLDSMEGKLTVGNTHTIKATVLPEEAAGYYPVTWTSSDEKVATVDSNGKVTAISAGKASITVTAGGFSTAYRVTVEAPKKVTTPKVTTSSSSSNSASTSAPSTTTPSNPAPSASTPDPAPAPQPAEPSYSDNSSNSYEEMPPQDNAPDPQPEQPSQPSSGDLTDGSGANGGMVIEGSADKSCSDQERAGALC